MLKRVKKILVTGLLEMKNNKILVTGLLEMKNNNVRIWEDMTR